QRLQLLGRDAGNDLAEEADAADALALLRLARLRRAGSAERELAAGFSQLPLHLAALVEHGVEARGRFARRHFKRGSNGLEAALLLVEIGQGRLAGQRLEPAHAGSDRAFGNDTDKPDVARGRDMGAAAQLDRVGLAG